LQAFSAKAVEMGLPSLATGALIGWEWLQREVDIFATFDVSHYPPKEHPNMVRVSGRKNQAGKLDIADRRGASHEFATPAVQAKLRAILWRQASLMPSFH
jgi:hypothetical protein